MLDLTTTVAEDDIDYESLHAIIGLLINPGSRSMEYGCSKNLGATWLLSGQPFVGFGKNKLNNTP